MAAVGSLHFAEAWVNGPILPTESGYGGWSVVDEEAAEGTLEFSGFDPVRWVLPILVDGWSAGVSVQEEWDAILALASMQGDQPPPQVIFTGSVPPELRAKAWLIEKVVPGSERLDDGLLKRMGATLNLIKPNFAHNVASPIKQAQAAVKGSKAKRTIKARPGDTLVKIAARELGDPSRWREISKLNGNLQPDNVKAGQKIKLP